MPNITDLKLVTISPPLAQDVEVSATIGNAQVGGWAMFLDGAFLAGGSGSTPVSLGKGAGLIGRVLEVSANITDVQGAHDRLSLRVRVTGHAEPIDIAHDGSPGGRAAYSILVQFGA